MHKVTLINAAGARTEHEYDSMERAAGEIGWKYPIIFDGKAGYLWGASGENASTPGFIETDEDFVQFKYAHLPERLQAVSKRFYELAEWLVLTVPASHQRSVSLLDLLRSKDAAVRAALAR